MNFFKEIFKKNSEVSSRRILAFWIGFFVLSYVIYVGINNENAIDFLNPILIFLGALLGITTTENILTMIDSKKNAMNKNTDQPNPDHEEHVVNNPLTSREDNTDQPNPDHEEH